MDPVSRKEKDRNDAAYALQQNRNPFIDIPQFADCIWANNCIGLSVAGTVARHARLRVYPNPATTEVAVSWPEAAPDEVLAVDVLNIQGQLLYHKDGRGSLRGVTVPVGDWPKGLYLLRVKTQHGVQAQKLVVE
jgi:hypothetical protein